MGDKQYKTNSYTDFFYYAFRNVLLVSIPLLVISTFILGFSVFHSSATGSSSGSDNLTITISSACTLSSVVDSEHSTNTNVGTYTSDIGKTTITTLCNDGNGYSVYANGYSNNEDGNTKLINAEHPEYSIDTGLATSGLTSQWAMKLNNIPEDPSPTPPIIESAYNDIYGLVPSSWTKVASRSFGTTDMSLGSSFTTTYSIYASSSQFAGTYRGQVKYALLHPYNNSNTPSFDSFNQAFAFYGKDKVTVADPITGSTDGYYKMQDMNSDICNSIKVYDELSATQLVDMRDNKLYWIAKLKDEHCWMTQNLDLDIVASSAVLTSNNTDLSTDESIYTDANTIYTLKEASDAYGYTYEKGIATWIPERGTIAYNQLNSATWMNDGNHPYSYDSLDNNGDPVHPDANVSGKHGLAGNYYNWTASLASNNSTNVTGDPANSICPKGWRLPNNFNKEFGNLLVSYDVIETNVSEFYLNGGFAKINTAPLYAVRGGRVNNGSLQYSGSTGYYWSSSTSRANAYNLNFDSSSVRPQGSNVKGIGAFIRCLAR